jgi:hypothetical protein
MKCLVKRRREARPVLSAIARMATEEGHGVIVSRYATSTIQDETTPSPINHTVPYGTDHFCRFPRHFMPGYHHFVPPGRRLRFLILKRIGSGGGVIRGLICYESRLFRKQFFGCRRQADTINPVMPKYFRLASGHRVIIRQTDNFEAGMDARLQQ